MANQIATFFESKPHEEGVHGVAEHINKFWEPRMRRQFFEMVDAGGEGLKPIVIEAAAQIRRPTAPRDSGTGRRSGRRCERVMVGDPIIALDQAEPYASKSRSSLCKDKEVTSSALPPSSSAS